MAHKASFARLISHSGLQKLAGERYFKRGLAYFRNGAVIHLRLGPDGISARVGGTEPCPYLVRFWIEKRSLKWGCACPLGTDGAFCKHLVATGLAWLSGRIRSRAATTDRLLPAEAVRETLDTTGETLLAQVAKERMSWDESLFAEVALAARASKHEGPGAANRHRHASRRKPSSSAD